MARSAAALPAAGAVAAGVGYDGGYSATPRIVFGALALLAGAAALAGAPGAARRLLAAPLVLVLLALAVLGAASAAWTAGPPADALRWALMVGGWAALAVAAGVLAAHPRALPVAVAVLAVVAVGAALVGLGAAALAHPPLALREAGRWRPASTFEYPPALGLLCVAALPGLLSGMLARRGTLALAAGFGGAVAGAVLGLAESRTQLALAGVVAAAALLWPARTVGAPRAAAAAAVALIAAAALGAWAVAGGYVVVTPPPDGPLRLAKLAGVVTGATLAWALARRTLRDGGRAAVLVAVVLLAAGLAAAATKPPARLISPGLAPAHPRRQATPPQPRPARPIRDRLLHGRLGIWRAAAQTFADRPLHGGGAGAFWEASRRRQEGRPTYYAHDLPLELAAELGVGGLLLALALYAAGGLVLWRARAGPAAWLLAPASAAFLAANLVDWPWQFAGLGAIWAATSGFLVASGHRSFEAQRVF